MMKKVTTAIIGGGAAGLFCAAHLDNTNSSVLVIERGERLGRKLSATGNGQGNVTNTNFGASHYFSFDESERAKIQTVISKRDDKEMVAFLESLGGLFQADERGRVYPTGRQASAVTDLLRFYLEKKGVGTSLSSKVTSIEKQEKGFLLTLEMQNGKEKIQAENVVVCAGGKAAKNFGTDGTAYALVKPFSHTVTALYPALVQIKTDIKEIKTLKGIRAFNAGVRAYQNKKLLAEVRGDVIFTEYGVSGDAIFRLSSYLTEIAENKTARISIDFLPDVSAEKLQKTVESKAENGGVFGELLCGILNNQIGRAVMKRAHNLSEVSFQAKNFTLDVTGTLGFDYAQVTKGGIPLKEVDENLQSNFCKGLYFAGEILDVDGECGGYNLQWAYSSARAVAETINQKSGKGGGQV